MDRAPRRRLRAAVESLEQRQLLAFELIGNGSFAANAASWNVSGEMRANAAFTTARSAPGYAYLSSPDGSLATSLNLNGSLRQKIAIPAGTTSALLTFWDRITTAETGTSPLDTMSVRILNANGATLTTLKTLSNVDANSAYTQVGPFDLAAYAGQTITLSFDGATNATLGTVFRIDDVSVQSDVAGPAGPVAANLPSPTLVTPGAGTTTAVPVVNSPMPRFRWNSVSSAASYSIVVETSSVFPTTVFDSNAYFGNQLRGNAFTMPSPLSAGTYRWSLRAYDGNGAITGVSPPLYFTVATSGYNRAFGVDIYSGTGVPNFATVKTNGTTNTTADDVSFLYTKATEGVTFDDDRVSANATGATNAGIAFGEYHFARPGNNSAADEAAHFAGVVGGTAFIPNTSTKYTNRLTAGNLTPMLDFEDEHANSTALGKAALSQWANDFCDAFVTLTGVVPIIYTFVSYATSYLDTSVLRYPLWMAQYPTSLAPSDAAIPLTSGAPSGTSPWPSGGWAMWQWSSTHGVAGFAANVDADVSNSDVPTFYDQFKIRSTTKGSISGTLFNDADSSGTQNSGEAGIGGRTVYLDSDDDGLLDPGELSTTTNGFGGYTFSNLLEGSYRVRQIVPGGFVATSPTGSTLVTLVAGLAATAKNFGSRSLDTTSPTVAATFNAGQSTLTLNFSEDVGNTITADDVVLTDSLGNVVPVTLTYSAATLSATVMPVGGTLADGSYHLAIAAGGFADAAGNLNAAYSFDFAQTHPTVAAAFQFDVVGQPLVLTFNEDVGATLDATDAVLTDASGNAVPITLTYSAATLSATIAATSGTLANGSYRLTFAAGTFADTAGRPNDAFSFDFFQLRGDINRDRSVDFNDLLILAANYGQASGTFATGDLSGDGQVNFDDLLILAGNYGASAPPLAAATAAATKPTRTKRVVNDVL